MYHYTMKNIYKALADFQQEVPVILKDTTGYGYNYADLPAIFETINPLLKKHGMGFYQAVNGTKIKTVVFHIESAEMLESETDIPQGVQLKGMNDFQVMGSAITYIKRYALSSLLGIVTDKDEDMAGKQKKVETNFEKAKKVTPEEAYDNAKKAIEEAGDDRVKVMAQVLNSKLLTDEMKQKLSDFNKEITENESPI